MTLIIVFYLEVNMTKINDIQQKIKSINGGQFQNLCDDYLQKKYN